MNEVPDDPARPTPTSTFPWGVVLIGMSILAVVTLACGIGVVWNYWTVQAEALAPYRLSVSRLEGDPALREALGDFSAPAMPGADESTFDTGPAGDIANFRYRVSGEKAGADIEAQLRYLESQEKWAVDQLRVRIVSMPRVVDRLRAKAADIGVNRRSLDNRLRLRRLAEAAWQTSRLVRARLAEQVLEEIDLLADEKDPGVSELIDSDEFADFEEQLEIWQGNEDRVLYVN